MRNCGKCPSDRFARRPLIESFMVRKVIHHHQVIKGEGILCARHGPECESECGGRGMVCKHVSGRGRGIR